jgi:hypothetical protein
MNFEMKIDSFWFGDTIDTFSMLFYKSEEFKNMTTFSYRNKQRESARLVTPILSLVFEGDF